MPKRTPETPVGHTGNEIVCPYCGTAQGDPWEFEDGDHETECQDCDRVFGFKATTEVTFESFVPKEKAHRG